MIKGIHHIGIATVDLDSLVGFYQGAVAFPLAARRTVAEQRESALLNASTTYLELTEVARGETAPPAERAVQGPGITHVCYQSPADNSAYKKFKEGGMKPVSRGNEPVDLSGRGITYYYARDWGGNLFETEQWENPPKPHPVWLAHVALVSHDIERESEFYACTIMGMESSPEIRRFRDNPNLDLVADLDDVDLYGTWIPTPNMLIELWQYVNPATPTSTERRSLKEIGYSKICFEVDDIAAEYERLVEAGVPFDSAPVQQGEQLVAYGFDPDGNVFQLLQFLDENDPLSLDKLMGE